MNLRQLTELVLQLNETPLTRIRLTKAIYFVHKELIRKKLMQPADITYIRLPLGPAPDGLPEIILNHPEIIIQDMPANPLYENKTYSLNKPETTSNTRAEIINAVQKTLKLLQGYRTPELVRASQDPSWATHSNGDKYHITTADLKNQFPNSGIRLKIHIKTPTNEIGALQATLLRGMLADIVKESTDLEYPDAETQNKATNDQDSIKLHKFIIKLPGWPKKKDK